MNHENGKKSISVTEKQEQWIKSQMTSGDFGNESKVIRDLTQEHQAKEQETPEDTQAIRKALLEGEKSGFSDKSIDDIWDKARKTHV